MKIKIIAYNCLNKHKYLISFHFIPYLSLYKYEGWSIFAGWLNYGVQIKINNKNIETTIPDKK